MEKQRDKPTKRRWRDAPSPCIDICKYPGGICKGCGMTKPEKKAWKRLSGKAARRPFLMTIMARLADMEGQRLERWQRVYRRKCARKNVPSPLERMPDRQP